MMKTKFKDLKLAYKISIVLIIVLAISFSVLVTLFSKLSSNDLIKTINSEFMLMSQNSAETATQVLNEPNEVATTLQQYIEVMGKEQPQTEETPKVKSRVYPADVSVTASTMEQYFLANLWAVVGNNENINGIRILFEPYAFDRGIKDYALYVDTQSAQKKGFATIGKYEEYSQENFYKTVKESGKVYLTNPYTYNNAEIITIAYPIMRNNTFSGVIAADIPVEQFAGINHMDPRYTTMFTTLFTGDNIFVYDVIYGSEYNGTSLSELIPEHEYNDIVSLQQKKEPFMIMTQHSDGGWVQRFYVPISCVDGQTWWINMGIMKSDLYKDVNRLKLIMALSSLVISVLICFIIVMILKKGLKPISTIVDAANHIESGNLDIDIHFDKNDEIGILANTFTTMAQNLKLLIDDIQYTLSEMANGNFNISSNHKEIYVGEFVHILDSIENINLTLNQTLQEINQVSDEVDVGGRQVSDSSQVLAQGATEQASSIQELSATINDISENIKKNADNAQIASQFTAETEKSIAQSNTYMYELMQAMQKIQDASQNIGKIIKTVEDIAFQTNILALNAAVEAARAGTAGKGFAVVADEVRNLSAKSSEAAKNTAQLIQSSIAAIENGYQIAENTSKSMRAAVDMAKDVTEKVDSIASVSAEQSASISQITIGIEQISSVVQTNSATSEQSAAASQELSGQAAVLKHLISKFKLKDAEHMHDNFQDM